MTPLMAASCRGDLEAAVVLMEAGADPAVTMSVGCLAGTCRELLAERTLVSGSSRCCRAV